MVIHIIVHNKSNPIEAYLNKDRAYERHTELRREQQAYGVVSLDIKDAVEPTHTEYDENDIEDLRYINDPIVSKHHF